MLWVFRRLLLLFLKRTTLLPAFAGFLFHFDFGPRQYCCCLFGVLSALRSTNVVFRFFCSLRRNMLILFQLPTISALGFFCYSFCSSCKKLFALTSVSAIMPAHISLLCEYWEIFKFFLLVLLYFKTNFCWFVELF